jgi:signal transduction histidine kinase
MKRLGEGHIPEPTHPSWKELASGSVDVQWVEFQGLVSGVQSNRLTLLLPEGSLEVQMENHFESELKQYQQAVVRIRGTLFATWEADTREVQFGSLLMRNASVSVDAPPPADPFDAPSKSARDLLRFDVQATALRRVKVLAQVLYVDGHEVFATDESSGLRVLTADDATLQPGDCFEAVGYPEISGPSPLLREALLRKTGRAGLPKPQALAGPDLMREGLDSALVSVRGRLIGMYSEKSSPVLEMQSNGHLFRARLKAGAHGQPSLRLNSRLQLTGVYAQTGRHPRPGNQVASFELLLNSASDVLVLSRPSWWTLERLAATIGFLLVVLLLATAWITQLRRRVEQRTRQLQHEIRERERAEHQRAIEAERSRIARDLHDDLGSGLTEIGVLASVGLRREKAAAAAQADFRRDKAAMVAQAGQRGPTDSDFPTLCRAIAAKARGLITALDVIVWAVDPQDNSLQSLADYLTSFVGDFLSHSGLPCRFKVPVTFPPIILSGEVRRDLLMAVKESLNNIVRHAQATEVEFRLAAVDSVLEIVIADNGKGFDPAVAWDGHGLKNLPARLAKLGGNCHVESLRGQGTTVTLRFPLAMPAAGNSTGA